MNELQMFDVKITRKEFLSLPVETRNRIMKEQVDRHTPNSSLPPLGDPPRRKMLIEIEVSADFEKRLDNQWMVEREIHADRWNWRWAEDPATCCTTGN